MMSLDELKMLKEQVNTKGDPQKNKEDVRIVVNMGTCSIAKGACETYAAILDEINTRSLTQVIVTQTGCMGMCESEPIINIVKQDEPKVTYGRVSPDKARHIIASHIVNGQVVGELVISIEVD